MQICTNFNKGILFVRLYGNLDIDKFNREIDYLLYKQGINYFTIDFCDVNIPDSVIGKIQSKLVEIFLNCGKVVMCGLNKFYQNRIGFSRNGLYYVNSEVEAFKYLGDD